MLLKASKKHHTRSHKDKKITFIFVTLLVVKIIDAQECADISSVCTENSNCRDCLRSHHCCVWCYDESFEGPRCNIATPLSTCNPAYIEPNAHTNSTIVSNPSFTDIGDDTTKAIQLRPSEFTIDLRRGEPINISIQYQPAKNYHLDLYYLMDLTYTMKPDLDTLKNLGSKLADELGMLTKNHRIAFGSYIDKPEMPFYHTDPINAENPCNLIGGVSCERGYLFKHKLNFTEDTTRFIEEVGQSSVSANADNLEGGFDALMQLMLCGGRLGWGDDSRKLVIIATEGEMHFAGDGLLAGYTKRNIDNCLVDNEGNYITDKHYDYPSLEEIHHQLKTKKMNVIVAAKQVAFDYYSNMAQVLKENIFVGKLENESTNVLKLVKDGYYEFMRQVNLYMNTSRVKGLDVEFFADCDGDGNWVKKGTCSNAEEGKAMDFKVQFLLNEYQDVDSEEFYIEEKNIYDRIKVKINFVGSKCNCPNVSNKTSICKHGQYSCGDCVCDDGWTGTQCTEECKNNITLCRYIQDDTLSLTCSGRGNCECSKCKCDLPYITGKFCQYTCPYDRFTRLICGGHGDCLEGICTCHKDYVGEACTCHNKTDNCKVPGSNKTCNGNGACKCNKCQCDVGYNGHYCEFCNRCSGLCSVYETNVIDHVLQKKQNVEKGTVQVELVEDLAQEERSCVYRYDDEEGKKCDIFYKYKINEDRTVDVQATKPICNAPLSAGFLALWIVLAFLVLGCLIIIIWKGRNMYRDKVEYQKFERERKMGSHTEQNPLYKNPVVTYQNPMGTVQVHSKSE